MDAGLKLLQHLDQVMDEKNGYPEEPTWGYAFSLLAALESEIYGNCDLFKEKSLSFYLSQSKLKKSYSWEFTVYAMQRAVRIYKINKDDFQLDKYQEKGTRMVNWTLLRQLNRMNAGQPKLKSMLIISLIKKLFTTDEGQILDERKTRSYQYHCFCLFVIAEIYEQYPSDSLKNWFINGCDFINRQALDSGVALYIGRGQEQIFGYGALLYTLTYAQEKFGFNANALPKIWSHVKGFQRQDGSIPLVLNKCQPEEPLVMFKVNKPNGWYGYNTLYDYQPFLAYCLLRASKLEPKYDNKD